MVLPDPALAREYNLKLISQRHLGRVIPSMKTYNYFMIGLAVIGPLLTQPFKHQPDSWFLPQTDLPYEAAKTEIVHTCNYVETGSFSNWMDDRPGYDMTDPWANRPSNRRFVVIKY